MNVRSFNRASLSSPRFTVAIPNNRGQTTVCFEAISVYFSDAHSINRRRSSTIFHSFQVMVLSPAKGESVTHVSGMKCYLCVGKHTKG